MTATMTIEEFNAVLVSDQEESSLLKALRRLMAIEKPEDIATLAEAVSGWSGWW